MVIRVYGGVGTNDLYQGKIYFNGAQKGTTKNLETAASDSSDANTTFTFGNTFIVPAGETGTLEIKADIKKGNGTAYSGGETFTVKIQSVTAQGKTSLASVSVGTATGYQLTIASGTLSAAKNQAVADWTNSYPTGVPGATEVLVGSFVITAGASEGADITAIKVKYSTTTNTILQNLKLYKGDKDTGTQIGEVQSSVTANTSYTFYPSPYISLEASEQFTLNVYADILTGASSGSQGYIVLDEVDGVGKTTNTSVNYTTPDVNGQTIYIASSGSLDVTAASDQPLSAQVIMGTSGVEFNKIKFTAGAGEAIKVTQIVVTATLSGGAPTSTVKNISLYDENGTLIGSAPSLTSAGKATFDLSSSAWEIPAASTKYLIIKADVNSYPYASSGASVKLGIAQNGITYKGAVSGNGGSDKPSSNILGNAMYTYKTKVEVALNENSPSGTNLVKQVAQHVLYFDVTNLGSYDAEFNSATFTIAYSPGTNGNTTTSQTRTCNLYDKDLGLSTSIGSGTIATGTTINGAQVSIDVSYNSADYTIPAGQTKTFYLLCDTRDVDDSSSNPGSYQFYINSGSDFNWDDKVSSAVQSNLTKTFPLYGYTLSY